MLTDIIAAQIDPVHVSLTDIIVTNDLIMFEPFDRENVFIRHMYLTLLMILHLFITVYPCIKPWTNVLKPHSPHYGDNFGNVGTHSRRGTWYVSGDNSHP